MSGGGPGVDHGRVRLAAVMVVWVDAMRATLDYQSFDLKMDYLL